MLLHGKHLDDPKQVSSLSQKPKRHNETVVFDQHNVLRTYSVSKVIASANNNKCALRIINKINSLYELFAVKGNSKSTVIELEML